MLFFIPLLLAETLSHFVGAYSAAKITRTRIDLKGFDSSGSGSSFNKFVIN